jgi:hypothetical protein
VIDLVFERDGYRIDTIAIDAVVRETHRFAGEATTHPVEDGSDVSDHYRAASRAVQLEGVITDTPLRVPATHNSGAVITQRTIEMPTEIFGMRLGPISLTVPGAPQQGSVSTFSTPMERVKSTWESFEQIFEEQKIITIVTSLRTYVDMALSELEVERRPGSYKFSCFAVQIRTVFSGRSAAVPIPKVVRAVKKVDKGKQQPKPAPEQVTPGQSVADSTAMNVPLLRDFLRMQ